MRATLAVAFAACLLLPACQPEQKGPTPEEIAAEKVSQAMQAGTGDDGDLPQVQVAPEGTRFDPPVRVSQIPPGSWYCDLGTVHYARTARGDAICPVCGLPLSRR